MFIIKYKSLFIGISVLLVLVSFGLFATFGIKKGIDFTGGTVVEISYIAADQSKMPAPLSTTETAELVAKNIAVYRTDISGNVPQYKFISTDTYEQVSAAITGVINPTGSRPFTVTSVSTVGPTLGEEMTNKAIIAVVLVIFAILAFIAFAFREVSEPVSSWKYGLSAMLTMAHDIIIPAGVYTLFSHYFGAEVNTLFVIALLTIMAVTISDKIVVFDRIRENLKAKKGDFDEIVGKSLIQTMARSVNTSLSTVLALIALYIFGPESTKFFALTLTVGMIVGTYSSIFVASPLLTIWNSKK